MIIKIILGVACGVLGAWLYDQKVNPVVIFFVSGAIFFGAMFIRKERTKNDYNTFEYLKKHSEQGEAAAQYKLGIVYRDGRGVIADDNEAVKWFQKAADQGYADAQYLLGVAYSIGRGGLFPNERKAVEWWQEAASQGHPEAQQELKKIYNLSE